MNKKLIRALSVSAMGLALVACGGTTSSSVAPSSSAPTSSTVSSEAQSSNDVKVEKDYTLKFGSYLKLSDGQIEVSTASVILDESNKVVDIYFDVLQAPLTVVDGNIQLNSTAKSVKDAGDKVVETKKELTTRYGMASTATQGEWNVQAAAFEDYCVGKTIDEIASQNYKSHYNADGTTEVTGCSISTGNFTGALQSISGTKTFKSSTAPVAGVGTIVSSFTPAAEGTFEVTLAGVATTASSDVVLESSVNVYQAPVTIVDGAVALDTTKKQCSAENIASNKNGNYTEVLSKRELGDLYGMAASATQGEWYTQANAFEDYAKGKSAASLTSTTYKSHYNADGETEVTGCSITVTGLAAAIAEGGSVLK